MGHASGRSRFLHRSTCTVQSPTLQSFTHALVWQLCHQQLQPEWCIWVIAIPYKLNIPVQAQASKQVLWLLAGHVSHMIHTKL